MANTRRIVGLSIVSAIVVGRLASPTMAQQDSGAPESQSSYPEVQCAVEPRSIGEIEALVSTSGTPQAEDGVPSWVIDKVPLGSPADDATVEEVTNAVLELTACVLARDFLREYALLTDEFVLEIAGGTDSFVENLQATPIGDEPVNPDLHVAVIQDVTRLDDGRVSAIVTLGGIEDSHPAPGRTFLMIFVEQKGRWLLDGQYEEVWSGDPNTQPVDIADLVGGDNKSTATPT